MDLGVMSVPLLIIGDHRIMGFNPAAIDAALASESDIRTESH
jgi:hypothetical protein